MDFTLLSIVIASLALILTFLKDFIVPFIFRPRLSLCGGNDGLCVQDASDQFNTLSRWVRIKIKNKDSFCSRTAHNCYVKLLWLKNSKHQKIKPLDPFPLMWVGYDSYRHDLAKGEWHFIDLVHENQPNRSLQFKIPIPLELIRNANAVLGPDEYTFKVGVYGDNFSPLYKKFKVKLTDRFGELAFFD